MIYAVCLPDHILVDDRVYRSRFRPLVWHEDFACFINHMYRPLVVFTVRINWMCRVYVKSACLTSRRLQWNSSVITIDITLWQLSHITWKHILELDELNLPFHYYHLDLPVVFVLIGSIRIETTGRSKSVVLKEPLIQYIRVLWYIFITHVYHTIEHTSIKHRVLISGLQKAAAISCMAAIGQYNFKLLWKVHEHIHTYTCSLLIGMQLWNLVEHWKIVDKGQKISFSSTLFYCYQLLQIKTSSAVTTCSIICAPKCVANTCDRIEWAPF